MEIGRWKVERFCRGGSRRPYKTTVSKILPNPPLRKEGISVATKWPLWGYAAVLKRLQESLFRKEGNDPAAAGKQGNFIKEIPDIRENSERRLVTER